MKTEHEFNGLDHLRALAITLVFLFHYNMFRHPAWTDGFSHYGWTGVDLFFVLSGFLISNQLFGEMQRRNTISLRIFYIKRCFRILPPYLFILLIYIFFPAFHERERLAPLWKMFTFTQNFNQDISVYGTFSHAWSLCVEEQFYFLFPLTLLFIWLTRLKKKSGWIIPAFFLLPLVLRWIIWTWFLAPIQGADEFGLNWYRWIYYPTYTRIDGLMAGIALAAVYRFRNYWLTPFYRFANAISIVIFILLIISYFTIANGHSSNATIFGFSGIALLYGLLTFAAIAPGSFLFRFKSFITKQLAVYSYSIYLSHKGLIHLSQIFFSGLGIDADGSTMFLICTIVCITGAFLIRICIEKPALMLRNELLNTLN
jgi:peptidoglycan/LPS O-acetylase OafA/YrhL